MTITILARKQDGAIVAPRTKKNSPQLIRNMARPILVPSEAYREWERAARGELIRQGICKKLAGNDTLFWLKGEAIAAPMNCRALIFRDKLIGDAVGYYQGIADFLEGAGIFTNDKFIVSWDGSRLLKDAHTPRIELELTQVGPGVAVNEEMFAGVRA